MGTWGVGIFSSDTACDVRDMYHDFLAYGYEDDLAEKKVMDYWIPQIGDSEDEVVFWLALASIEHKYGRLSDKVKEKAEYFIKNDLTLWDKAQKKKRKAVLEKLEYTLSTPATRRKVPPIKAQTIEWKKGDIVLARLNTQRDEEPRYFALQVFDVICVPYSSFLTDGPQNQIPVIGIYKWIGKSIPSINELLECGFVACTPSPIIQEDMMLPRVWCMIVNNSDRKKYQYTVLENSTEYLSLIDEKSIASRIGSYWGSFPAVEALLLHQIKG